MIKMSDIFERLPKGSLFKRDKESTEVKKERLETELRPAKRVADTCATLGWKDIVALGQARMASINNSIIELSRDAVSNELDMVKLHGERDGIQSFYDAIASVVNQVSVLTVKLKRIEESSKAENLQKSRLSA